MGSHNLLHGFHVLVFWERKREEGRRGERGGDFFFGDSLVLEAVLIYGKHFILGFTFFSLQGHPHFGVHILFGSCLEF